ncbi:MAG: hypothetical protein F6K58_15945 [Symploca sp. SIO2E9]|nr:hypothetical protein [Symploca sp. SIO2E9]
MKSILVATIGTRDVMFQISSGEWYNIGDDRMQDGDIIGEQAKVIADLSVKSPISYRDLTKYLFDHIEIYRSRIKPIIIGKLITEKGANLEKVYLIATDQKPEVTQRKKDSVHAAQLIKDWVIHELDSLKAEDVEIITLGEDGTNPSNFEEMFRWFRQVWQHKIPQPSGELWVCLKGGVGQTSEAARISGLSRYGDRIQFFEFKQNTKANRQGIPSDYSGPFLGTNYIWDRTQQQVLKLLKRYDYAEVNDLLQPYFKQDPKGFSSLPNLIEAGIAWNQGEFDIFFSLVKDYLTAAEQRETEWWWKAYEQAQLGLVRLEQENTTEAMLHSYRSIEGALYLWAKHSFPDDVKERQDKFPLIYKSITHKYHALKTKLTKYEARKLDREGNIELKGRVLQGLLEVAISEAETSEDFKAYWKARGMRNNLSHRLGGLEKNNLFKAWGEDIKDAQQWQRRILNCLNLITKQKFKSLSQASLFSKIHNQVVDEITHYELKM